MIVVVAAEAREFDGLRRHLRNTRRLRWPGAFAEEGQLKGRSLVLVANGPGPRLAGQAADEAKKRYEVEVLISTGFCGALDSAVQPGSVFIGTEVNGRPAAVPRAQQTPHCGPLHSSDRVAITIEDKRQLRSTGALAVDMEAEALAGRAERWGVPFYCIRAVTDGAAEELPMDFNALRDADGRFNRIRIVAAALRRPIQRIPRLMALARKCRRASAALGDFLANCEF